MTDELNESETTRDEKGRFLPGVSGNPAGKPPGAKNFNTILTEAIKQIAKANDLTEVQVEMDLVKMALKMARDGNYQFFKDIMDRRYGQARQSIQMGLEENIDQIEVKIVKGDNTPDSHETPQGA